METLNNPFHSRCFRLVVLSDSQGTDSGINLSIFKNLLEQVRSLSIQPLKIILLGDLVTGSKASVPLDEQYAALKKTFSSYYPIDKLLPVPGNHDLGIHNYGEAKEIIYSKAFDNFQATGFLKAYNRTAYYVDIADVRLIMLNPYHFGESYEITNEQFKWLKTVVSEPMLHKIVFVHLPPFPTGSHVKRPLNLTPYKRNKLWSVLDKNGVSLVFCGHEHNYSRRLINSDFGEGQFNFKKDIYQIICGGAGGTLTASFKDTKGVVVPPTAVHHFVIVDIDMVNIIVQAISITGEVIDKFTI